MKLKLFISVTLILFTGYIAGYDGNILKTTDGGGTLVSIKTVGNNIPQNSYLCQNYPNPFNPKTMISFELSNDAEVKLIVYDIMGREIKSILNGQLSTGRHVYEFDGSNFASGVYFYRMEVEGEKHFVMTKRMVLIK